MFSKSNKAQEAFSFDDACITFRIQHVLVGFRALLSLQRQILQDRPPCHFLPSLQHPHQFFPATIHFVEYLVQLIHVFFVHFCQFKHVLGHAHEQIFLVLVRSIALILLLVHFWIHDVFALFVFYALHFTIFIFNWRFHDAQFLRDRSKLDFWDALCHVWEAKFILHWVADKIFEALLWMFFPETSHAFCTPIRNVIFLLDLVPKSCPLASFYVGDGNLKNFNSLS